MTCVLRSSDSTGLKVPGPTSRSRSAIRTPAVASRSSSASVKCNPAVGAATEPSRRAYTVWYRSSSMEPGAWVMYGGSGSRPNRAIALSALAPMKRTMRLPSSSTSTVSTNTPGPERDSLSRPHRAPRAAHGDPGVVGAGVNEQHFSLATRWPGAEQSRMTHTCGVEDQQVTRRDQRKQVPEHRIAKRRPASLAALPRPAAGCPLQHQQPALSPHCHRLLRDQFRGQFIVEVGKDQRTLSHQRSWSAAEEA